MWKLINSKPIRMFEVIKNIWYIGNTKILNINKILNKCICLDYSIKKNIISIISPKICIMWNLKDRIMKRKVFILAFKSNSIYYVDFSGTSMTQLTHIFKMILCL